MERYTPIIHKVMAGSGGGSMSSANIRVLGNVNHPPIILGNTNAHVKHFNPHHHHK